MIIAQALARVIGFFYTIFVAKTLGVVDFGLFSVALTYFSIISTFTDFGFNRYLIREAVKDRANLSWLIFNISILRLTFASVIILIFTLAIYFLDSDKMRVGISVLAVMAILPQVLSSTIDAVFVAIKKLQLSAIALVGLTICTSSAGVLLIGDHGVVGAISALVIGYLFYLIILFLMLRNEKIDFFGKIREEKYIELLKKSLPYGALAAIGFVSFKMDTIILSYIKGNFEVGIYSAGYRFLEAITFVPSAVSLALFPVLTNLHETNIKELKKVYEKSMKLMLGLGLLGFLGFFFILPLIISYLLPSYGETTTVIKILAFAVPFLFLHIPAGQVLLTSNKFLKDLFVIYLGLIFINFILYVSLINLFGFRGAAFVTVLSEIMTLTAFSLLIQRKVFKAFFRYSK